MIDLGSLVARVEVDSKDGVSSLKNFGDEVQEVDKKSTNVVGKLKKLVAGLGIGIAIKKVTDGLVGCTKKADELKQAFNTLQTQTGATDAEMV